MYDLHVHSKYSFDGDRSGAGEIDFIAETALSMGLRGIAITDHCDIDGELAGYYPKCDFDAVRRDVFAAKEKFAGRLDILFGVELGQPHVEPEAARRLLEKYRFEFVLGSLHNLRGAPDFMFMKYNVMEREVLDWLMSRMFDELIEIARFGGITSMAHLTYPARYLRAEGIDYDFLKFEDKLRQLFHIMKENGLYLEINTSGLTRPGDGKTSPDDDIIALYEDCGCNLFTIGSDRHHAIRL